MGIVRDDRIELTDRVDIDCLAEMILNAIAEKSGRCVKWLSFEVLADYELEDDES